MRYQEFYSKYLNNMNVRSNGQAEAVCPFHDDNRPSLSVNLSSGLWICHACGKRGNVRQFAALLGVEPPQGVVGGKEAYEAEYVYFDEEGVPLFRILRHHPKTFHAERVSPDGSFSKEMKGVRKVLFNLPLVVRSSAIVLVEGEKDALNVEAALQAFFKIGNELAITTAPFGAKKWLREYSASLAGRHVVQIADNDGVGAEYAAQVKAVSKGFASYALYQVPEQFKDVSEWLEACPDAAATLAQDVRNLLDAAKKQLVPQYESLEDLQQRHIELPEGFLGRHYISRGDVVVVSGPHKHGKSLLTVQLGLCLAKGKPFLGIPVPRVCRALLMQKEVKEAFLRERVSKMVEDAPSNFAHCSDPHLRFDDEQQLRRIKNLLEDTRPDVVIVDPMRMYHDLDENDSKSMSRFMETLKAVVAEYKIALIVVHHHAKPGAGDRRGGNKHRGSSAIGDLSDQNITFDLVDPNKVHIGEDSLDDWGLLEFQLRNARNPKPLILRRDDKTLLYEVQNPESYKKVSSEHVRTYMLSKRQNEWVPVAEVVTHVGEQREASAPVVRKAIEEGVGIYFSKRPIRGARGNAQEISLIDGAAIFVEPQDNPPFELEATGTDGNVTGFSSPSFNVGEKKRWG